MNALIKTIFIHFLQNLPRFELKGAGIVSSLKNEHKDREPINLSDIQNLLLYALGGNNMSHPPSRWCSLEKPHNLTHIIALVVDGLTIKDYIKYEHLFPKLTK